MLRTRLRVTSCFLWVAFTLLGFYSPSPAHAETYTATQTERDFYFTSSEQMTMTIRTYAQQFGIDSMLWVYNGEQLVTANDDYFGLDSYVSFPMVPGVTYRLRAGVCCGDPDRWYGNSYQIEPSMVPDNVPSTTTSSTSTTTTTIETSTTTTVVPTTTTTSTTTSSTTTVPQTSTTVLPSTTSLPPTTTTSSSTTVAPETTTTISSTSTSTSTSVPLPFGTTSSTQIPSTTTSVATSTSTTTTSTTVSASTTTIAPEEEPLQAIPAEKVAEAVMSQIEDATDEELETFFEELNMVMLTAEQQDAVAEALSNAPEDVKKLFEETVNIFGEGFDNYTPTGSTVTVGQRKVLIAATGVIFMAPTVSVSSSSGSQSSDSRRRK